jgi:hypothetical protein
VKAFLLANNVKEQALSETSHATKRANAAASDEGKKNPRTSSKAQSILGKKGAAAKKH